MAVLQAVLQYENGMFILPAGTVMTPDILSACIQQHKVLLPRYSRLKALYEGSHAILTAPAKAAYKPDNRLVANFAKYIVDTLVGYFIGIPVKTTHPAPAAAAYLDYLDQYNGQDDNNAEIAKMCSVFGHAFELVYTDETGEVGLTPVSPLEAFVVYDDSISRRPLFGVRYYKDANSKITGSVSDSAGITYFHNDGGYIFDSIQSHYFRGVPLVEYVENAERKGAFESVEALINAYDKALSEKANDVDYYADAYLKILGAALDKDTLVRLRDSRIINLDGAESDKVIVEFMQKPDADGTQENLINRLERLIYQLSMVANINDENFGTSSGIALKYKLQSMNNLAKTKERKFVAGLQRRYRLIASLPSSRLPDWTGISYQFTRNIPANLLEESQIAGNLSGITSDATRLKVLSCVDNVEDELKRKRKEADDEMDDFNRTRMEVDNDADEPEILGAASATTLGAVGAG